MPWEVWEIWEGGHYQQEEVALQFIVCLLPHCSPTHHGPKWKEAPSCIACQGGGRRKACSDACLDLDGLPPGSDPSFSLDISSILVSCLFLSSPPASGVLIRPPPSQAHSIFLLVRFRSGSIRSLTIPILGSQHIL